MTPLRLAQPTDAPALLEIYAPVVVSTPISFETEPPTTDEMARRIAATLRFAPWLVFLEGPRILGYAYASKHRERAAYRWSVDVSVYVRAGHRRRGVARILYTELFERLRRQGFRAAHAVITLPNAASVALHESFGFRPVGVYPRVGFKLGRWHDIGAWQLELAERVSEPRPPLTLEALSSGAPPPGP